MIHQASIAGVLLREHDSPEQALAYAERKSKILLAMQHAGGLDYEEAARMIRGLIAKSTTERDGEYLK